MNLAVRVPLPYGVRVHDDRNSNHILKGDQCLIVEYRLGDEILLINALEETIEAIRRGPRENRIN